MHTIDGYALASKTRAVDIMLPGLFFLVYIWLQLTIEQILGTPLMEMLLALGTPMFRYTPAAC